MSQPQTVVVTRERFDQHQQTYIYKVVRLVNTLNPSVGTELTTREVQTLYQEFSMLLDPTVPPCLATVEVI